MAHRIPYEADLNEQQLEAVLHTGSPLLVLAGAGSGKTRVITFKIAYLINECGYLPEEMFAVTFTNKASGEMKERVNQLVGKDVNVWVRTFHSSAARLLRIWGESLGVPRDFSIIDQKDQRTLVRRIVDGMNIDSDTYRPERYVYLINRAKDQLLTAEEAEHSHFSTDIHFDEVYHRYENALLKERLFDFGDLIFRLSRGLRENGTVLARIKERFRYILVDEFQDTNHAQYELVRQLSSSDGSVCAVGDDDQSIYGFRGAQVENILNFSKDYQNCRIIKLEENYRSCQNILSASSQLIHNNSERLGKTLFTKKGAGDKIVICRTGSDRDEAGYVAGTLRELVMGGEYRYNDIGVFYRMNAQSRIFESVFNQAQIPYAIVGGLRFFEREEIKDVLAYIRLAANPMDEISLRRAANRPARGIGRRTVDSIVDSCIGRGLSLLEAEDHLEVVPSRKRLVGEFVACISDIRERLDTEAPPALLKHVYDATGYLEWLKGERRDEKIGNLEELYNAVDEFHRNSPDSPILEFLEEVSLNQGARNDEFDGNRVHLITMHNAKGLEFPVVFMAGMEEGIFPHYRSGEAQKDIQEERRLCYVGMTRAMERLYLSAARSRMLFGRTVERDVSSFIGEIPAELVKKVSYGVSAGLRTGRHSRIPAVSAAKQRKIPVERDISWVREGVKIVHRDFGGGTVRSLKNEIAEIEFDDGTIMKFMLRYTPLEIGGE